MKLIKTLFLFGFLLFQSNRILAQSEDAYYKAIATEMYVKNQTTNKWDLYQKNGATNITIVIEEQFLSIQALKPTIYRLYKADIEEINTELLFGSRYTAKDLKTEEYCVIDVVKSKSSNTYLISIIKNNVNLRYFIDRN